ncbi:MAG: DUF1566 domain-containing protein [Pseudomonadota bacterium]
MSRFTINPDNTVTDTSTGLIWSRETIAKRATHEEAKAAAEKLGEGWRLPTADELLSLVDRTRYSPAIDTDAFPDTKNDWYWTDTAYAPAPSSAVWVVFFYLGLAGGYRRSYGACVRAVRVAPAGQ